jgi:ATP/maltotriose-dependent transcriptional regulator MalT
MTMPILATKLSIPPLRPNLVHRPHLYERLNEGAQRPLTLISAPAGFGKTTLVTDWLAERRQPAAWLSLDAGDNDLARFLTYLVAALQTVSAGIGAAALEALQSSQPPPFEALLTALLNDLVTSTVDPFVLVLDDYHTLDTPLVDQALTFLLERVPAQLHLVMTTREDPRLPLARLRARDQLTELRAADLRFTPAEAASFLNQAMGLNLAAGDIATLEARTEGWIAGLQLAALSLRGLQDAAGFISAFAGDHRYIVDYLADEVLARQPGDVRRFLLQTSVLDQLTGALCDAVTGQMGSDAWLAALERGNYFLVALDDQRRWYRYHHLFADALQARLLAEEPAQVATLRRRASVWFEREGRAPEAIRYALAAGEPEDLARVADLAELATPSMRQTRQETALLGWLRALPDELLQRRPVLSVWYAHALLASGDSEGVERRLRDAERFLDTPDESSAMVVVDQEAFHQLPGLIAMARAARALARGDAGATVTEAQRALALIPESDHVGRGGALALLGLASWLRGDLETAYQTFAEGMTRVRRAGLFSDAINGVIALAEIRIAQGHLSDAMRLYERGLRLATRQNGPEDAPTLRGAADMYVGLSDLHRERNELDAAARQLEKSQELGDLAGMPQYPYRWRVAMARLRAAQADPDGALRLLDEAERLYVGDFFPTVRPIAALRARVWIAQGKPGAALGWARETGLSAHDELSYLREFEHITLARALLARYMSDRSDELALREALGLLERLLAAAEAGGRTGSVIEILIVQALAQHARGSLPAALASLRQALSLAEPEGYVRMFVDEGPPMATLLKASTRRESGPSYARQLLAAFAAADETPANQQGLIEPLSERELDVLRLLGADLDGPEIARELTVSLNTVRTHTRRIYSKLGVNSRRAAVRRAEELGFLSRARKH